ncbi:MAG: DUF6152 family protein [Vicinamibacterales bacterium]
MTIHFRRYGTGALLAALLCVGLSATRVLAHHSFAMYDQTKIVTMTGVVTRFVSQANHAEIHFVPLGPDSKPVRDAAGKPTSWGIEMGGAAAEAARGVSVTTFAPGTIFSAKLNPLRDGNSFGSKVGALAKCPKGKVPAPGKHCDSVEGAEIVGGEAF